MYIVDFSGETGMYPNQLVNRLYAIVPNSSGTCTLRQRGLPEFGPAAITAIEDCLGGAD